MILMLFKMLKILSSGRISGIIVVGGFESSVVEFLNGDLKMKQLSNLPHKIGASSMVAHFGTILFCGGFGNSKNCLQLDNGTWKRHSILNDKRAWHSAVTTQIGTFIFGGDDSSTTYEYLPKDSTKWLTGKTEIPEGFISGCAIAVKSQQEIWLIGGGTTEKRILSLDVESHTFQVLPFHVGRQAGHRCAFIPNTNKIMLTGGNSSSTEVLDTEDGSVTMATPMNSKRIAHCMGVVTINGIDRLAVFGGYPRMFDDSV